jgi:hypothetical protein
MTPANDPPADTAGLAGHLVFVIDAAAPVLVQQACADAATTLAAQTGMPVTVATAPVDRLDALRDTLGRDADARTREYARHHGRILRWRCPRRRSSGPMAARRCGFSWRPR